MAESCKRRNGPKDSMKGGELLDWLTDYQLLTQNFVSLSYFEGILCENFNISPDNVSNDKHSHNNWNFFQKTSY